MESRYVGDVGDFAGSAVVTHCFFKGRLKRQIIKGIFGLAADQIQQQPFELPGGGLTISSGIRSAHQDTGFQISNYELGLAIVDSGSTPGNFMPQSFQGF